MGENLKATKYADGKTIPLVTDNTAWDNMTTTGGYCWYDNDATNKDIYGGLYHWYGSKHRETVPNGWHHTIRCWMDKRRTTFLGGETVAGGKLKETGTVHWLSPNEAATNESGFNCSSGRHSR